MKFIALLFLLLTTLAGQAYAQTSPTPTIGPGVIWTPQQWIAAWSSKIDTSPATGGPTIATALLGSGTVLSPNVLPPATQTVAGILSLAAANAAAAIQSAGPGLSLVGTALGLPTFGTPGVYSNITLDAYGRVTAARAINATDVSTALGTPAPYLGEVATRAALPNYFNGTYTHFMSRSTHYARQTITSLRIVVPNFWVSPQVGELGTGAAATYTASVEYPAGTFHQILFGGSVAGSVPNDTTLLSDAVSVSVPNGQPFWVRMYYSNASGGVFRLWSVNQTQAVAVGDSLNYLNSPTDQTMGGTVTNSSPLVFDFPVAIVANTTLASACLIGDSRMLGTADAQGDQTLDDGPTARYIGKRFGYINFGITSNTIAAFTEDANTNEVALGHYCSFGIDEYGVNDFGNGVTASQIVGLRQYAAQNMFPELQMYGETLEPESTSTDSWATAGNQTPFTYNSARNTLNASIVSGIPGELDYIDMAGMVDPINSGIWPSTGAANGCTSDGVHENATAAQLANNGNACGVYNNPFRNIDFSRR